MGVLKYKHGERRCYKCREIKPLEKFRDDRWKPMGKSYLCLICDRLKSASWRERNPQHKYLGIRFEVLQRDNFTCTYCGRKPPEVELEVDHIFPKSKGGNDTKDNLTTACWECNLGKRDKVL